MHVFRRNNELCYSSEDALTYQLRAAPTMRSGWLDRYAGASFDQSRPVKMSLSRSSGSLWKILASCGLLATAVFVGRWTAPEPRLCDAPDSSSAPSPVRFSTGDLDSAVGASGFERCPSAIQVRQIVRSELDRMGAGLPAASVAGQDPRQSSGQSETPESLRGAAETEALVHAAIARGEWTDDDQRRWSVLSLEIAPAMRVELLRHLAVAVNRKTLVIKSETLPIGPTRGR